MGDDEDIGVVDYRATQAILDVEELALSTAHLNVDLLLYGETGAGKDSLAERIHVLSGRRGAFVPVNCAAIPEGLAESLLFGSVSGAFTGANRGRIGYIEAADQGTLYLDEIDSMPLGLQAKLLRALETRCIQRVGAPEVIPVHFRAVASAQRSLDQLIDEGLFRRDLFFRLNVLTVQLPPLRETKERILPLFEHFLHAAALQFGKPVPPMDAQVTHCLLTYSWPGNMRELKSAANRLVLGFPLLGQGGETDVASPGQLKTQLRTIERLLIRESLKRNKQSIAAASEELGLPRRTLYHRMKELDM